LLLFDLKRSISSGLKEKYATSEADIRADPISSIIRTIRPVIVLKSGEFTGMAVKIDTTDSVLSGSN